MAGINVLYGLTRHDLNKWSQHYKLILLGKQSFNRYGERLYVTRLTH